jgi:serine/threonine-protein kinase RsbW
LPGSADLVDVAGTDKIGAADMRLSATVSLPRRPSSVAHARHILETLLGLLATSHDESSHLALLLTEAVANAVQHAQSGSPVDLTITIEDDECLIEVGNQGEHPGPAALAGGLPAPLTTAGGRGLPLIAALSDAAAFVPTPPGRVLLRMSKRLVPGTDGSAGPG